MGHIKDPVPLIEKGRVSCPGGTCPPSLIHQVIIITGLNKLYNCMFSPCSRLYYMFSPVLYVLACMFPPDWAEAVCVKRFISYLP